MSIRKTASGRFQARIKSGRVDVASRTFDRKKDAQEWEAAQRRALDLPDSFDPRAGNEAFSSAWDRWQATRSNSRATTTRNTDRAAFAALPASIRNRAVGTLRAASFESHYNSLLGTLAPASVRRYRGVYGSFMAWCVREGLCRSNAALAASLSDGKAAKPQKEIWPLTIDELRAVHADLVERSGKATGDIALVLGLSGIRPGELFALRVRDVQRLPVPAVRVTRSKSDASELRHTTKTGRSRVVPLMDDVWAIVEPLTRGRAADDLLFPSAVGGFRFLSNWKRDSGWGDLGLGRRVYDLRHTAATLWLRSGVDVKTAAQWLGHASAKLTLDQYAHWMGSDADVATLARLNTALGAGGVRGERGDSQEVVGAN